MLRIESLDPMTSLEDQLRRSTGPITMVNTYVVPAEALDEFLALWRVDAALMRSRPGFVSSELHGGVAGSRLLLNVAVWESTEALAAALAAASTNPAIQQTSATLPDGIVLYPQIYYRDAFEGVYQESTVDNCREDPPPT